MKLDEAVRSSYFKRPGWGPVFCKKDYQGGIRFYSTKRVDYSEIPDMRLGAGDIVADDWITSATTIFTLAQKAYEEFYRTDEKALPYSSLWANQSDAIKQRWMDVASKIAAYPDAFL